MGNLAGWLMYGVSMDGTLSASQVRAIVANVSPAAVEVFAEHEADLIPTLARCRPPTGRRVHATAALAEGALDRPGG